MARNGSGTYSLPEASFVYNTVISETAMNSNLSDIASALTASIAKDGQTTPTADLPMGGYNHTGVGNASARDDYAAAGQVQDGSFIWCGTAGGTADAITLTPSPAITAYATGMEFRWKASANANTGAATVAISGLTTKALEINDSALSAGDHAANKYYRGIYDGTAFQIEQISAGAGGDVSGPASSTDNVWARFDGTGGKTLQNGTWAEDDSGDVTAGGTVTFGAGDGVILTEGTAVSTPANTGALYTKDTGGQPELFYREESDGDEVQLTSGGAVNVNAGITLATAQTTTSGTAFDFTGIPAGVNDIIVMFDQVSLSGTDNFLVQIGDSGGIETSSYLSRSGQVAGTTQVGSGSGFIIRRAAATDTTTGWMRLTRMTGNKWVSGHTTTQDTGTNDCHNGGGVKELSAELTQVRITRTGTDTFDAGSVAIAYLS